MQQGTLINLVIGRFTHSAPVFDMNLIKQNWIREIAKQDMGAMEVSIFGGTSQKPKVQGSLGRPPFLFTLACTGKTIKKKLYII